MPRVVLSALRHIKISRVRMSYYDHDLGRQSAGVTARSSKENHTTAKKMSPSKRRKLSQNGTDRAEQNNHEDQATTTSPPPSPKVPSEAPTSESQPSSSFTDRQQRFRALQQRAQKSSQQNIKASAAESARLATDENALTALQRKQAIAGHNLLKAETEAAGEDFERKRAW